MTAGRQIDDESFDAGREAVEQVLGIWNIGVDKDDALGRAVVGTRHTSPVAIGSVAAIGRTCVSGFLPNNPILCLIRHGQSALAAHLPEPGKGDN